MESRNAATSPGPAASAADSEKANVALEQLWNDVLAAFKEPLPEADEAITELLAWAIDHDTGAIYDLVKPAKNAMKPVGEWNHMVITCDKNLITVELNGEKVNRMDLDEWTEPNKRPDGSAHKFDIAYKDHPRKGYIGLQDHGQDCWYKNIKLLPLK